MNTAFRFTPQVLEQIRLLAGTMPGRDLAEHIGCSYGSLRKFASEQGISLRVGTALPDVERPAPDDRAVARIDTLRSSIVELNGLQLSADVMLRLQRKAQSRDVRPEALAAQLLSLIAIDDLFVAVLDEGR